MKIIGFRKVFKLILAILAMVLILTISPGSPRIFIILWTMLQYLVIIGILLSTMFTIPDVFKILKLADKIDMLNDLNNCSRNKILARADSILTFITLVFITIFLSNPKLLINNSRYRKKMK